MLSNKVCNYRQWNQSLILKLKIIMSTDVSFVLNANELITNCYKQPGRNTSLNNWCSLQLFPVNHFHLWTDILGRILVLKTILNNLQRNWSKPTWANGVKGFPLNNVRYTGDKINSNHCYYTENHSNVHRDSKNV